MKRRFSLTAQLTGMIELLMVGFSAVVLALFLMSARSLLLRHFESSLQRDAYVIAKELALSLDRSQEETLYARMSGSGAFSSLMLYEELTHADIWVVDGQHTIYTHQNDAPNILRGERLPAILEALTAQALLGQNGFSSSSIGGRTMLCSSAPMTDAHGDIFAVGVMASPLDERVSMGPELTALLLSMAAALALMCAMCVIFARSFLRPIKRMNRTAHTLAGGDYTAVTGISRLDEIGELAASMDALAQRLEEARQERERTELEKQEFCAASRTSSRRPSASSAARWRRSRKGSLRRPTRSARPPGRCFPKSSACRSSSASCSTSPGCRRRAFSWILRLWTWASCWATC